MFSADHPLPCSIQLF